jgi:hypothetical protein
MEIKELFQLEGDNAGRSIQRLTLRGILSPYVARTARWIQRKY